MSELRLRWSVHEAAKPYARPFMVTFVDDDGVDLGSVALSGADLLYQRQFRIAVATLAGEMFLLDSVETDVDPQRAWLDVIGNLMPARTVAEVAPRSTFDAERGRVVGFVVTCTGGEVAAVDAQALLEYQELQAAVAHQTGGLVRVATVEAESDHRPRQLAWDAWLRTHVQRPRDDDAMASSWPWG